MSIFRAEKSDFIGLPRRGSQQEVGKGRRSSSRDGGNLVTESFSVSASHSRNCCSPLSKLRRQCEQRRALKLIIFLPATGCEFESDSRVCFYFGRKICSTLFSSIFQPEDVFRAAGQH